MPDLQEPWDKLINPDILEHCELKSNDSLTENSYTVKLSTRSADVLAAFEGLPQHIEITYKLGLVSDGRVKFHVSIWDVNVLELQFKSNDKVQKFWGQLSTFSYVEREQKVNEKMNRIEKTLKEMDL